MEDLFILVAISEIKFEAAIVASRVCAGLSHFVPH